MTRAHNDLPTFWSETLSLRIFMLVPAIHARRFGLSILPRLQPAPLFTFRQRLEPAVRMVVEERCLRLRLLVMPPLPGRSEIWRRRPCNHRVGGCNVLFVSKAARSRKLPVLHAAHRCQATSACHAGDKNDGEQGHDEVHCRPACGKLHLERAQPLRHLGPAERQVLAALHC